MPGWGKSAAFVEFPSIAMRRKALKKSFEEATPKPGNLLRPTRGKPSRQSIITLGKGRQLDAEA